MIEEFECSVAVVLSVAGLLVVCVAAVAWLYRLRREVERTPLPETKTVRPSRVRRRRHVVQRFIVKIAAFESSKIKLHADPGSRSLAAAVRNGQVDTIMLGTRLVSLKAIAEENLLGQLVFEMGADPSPEVTPARLTSALLPANSGGNVTLALGWLSK